MADAGIDGRFRPGDAVFAAFAPGCPVWRVGALYVLAGIAAFLPWLILSALGLARGALPMGATGAAPTAAASLGSLLTLPLAATAEAALLRRMLSRARPTPLAHDAGWILLIHIAMAAMIVALIVVAVVGGLLWGLMLFAASGAAEAGAAPSPVWIVGGGAGVLILAGGAGAAAIYGLLRLSLAPAMTVAEGRLRLFESWRATRGRVLALFGAHLVRMALLVLFSVVTLVCVTLVGLAAVWPHPGDALSALAGRAAPPAALLGAGVGVLILWVVFGRLVDFADIAMRAGIAARGLQPDAAR